MTSPTILANARLILPDTTRTGGVVMRDGQIEALLDGATVPPGGIDCGGDWLAPGLVELHTDNLERHVQPRPGVAWPPVAAIVAHDAELAVCGVTTVLDSMRVGSIPWQRDYRPYARGLANQLLAIRDQDVLRISHHLHLRAEICSETLIEELEEFGPTDRVRLVSMMDHTPGQRQFRDISMLAQFLKGRYGMDDESFDTYMDQLVALRESVGSSHEEAAVAAARRLGAVLASHDDTTAEQVAESAAYGVKLAEFPTTKEAATACHTHGILTILGAPNLIRGASHSGNIAAHELAREGLLDIISSDYVPSALLSAAMLLADLWDDLPRAMATVTATPAAAVWLDDRGRIAPGLRADLIRFSMVDDTPILRETWVQGRRVA